MVFVPDIISIPNKKNELNADIVGNKAYSRVIIDQLNLPTPPAIIITSEVFKHFLHYQDGQKKWQQIVQNGNPTSPEQMNAVSHRITSYNVCYTKLLRKPPASRN